VTPKRKQSGNGTSMLDIHVLNKERKRNKMGGFAIKPALEAENAAKLLVEERLTRSRRSRVQLSW
jgi:hypothetical protein